MAEYCFKCKQVTETKSVSHPSGVEFTCAECGWQVDYLHDEYDYDPCNEPIGSCEDCGTNIYEDEDDGSGLCDQCQWYIAVANGEIDP